MSRLVVRESFEKWGEALALFPSKMHITVSGGIWTLGLQEAAMAWLDIGDRLTCVANTLVVFLEGPECGLDIHVWVDLCCNQEEGLRKLVCASPLFV